MNIETLLREPTDKELQHLLQHIGFDEARYEKANLEQADLTYKALRCKLAAMKLKLRRSRHLEVLLAQTGLEVRKAKKRQSTTERITEAVIKDMVTVDKQCLKARVKLEEAMMLEAAFDAVVKAYSSRAGVIRVVTDLRIREMGSDLRAVRERMATESLEHVARDARNRVKKMEGR